MPEKKFLGHQDTASDGVAAHQEGLVCASHRYPRNSGSHARVSPTLRWGRWDQPTLVDLILKADHRHFTRQLGEDVFSHVLRKSSEPIAIELNARQQAVLA